MDKNLAAKILVMFCLLIILLGGPAEGVTIFVDGIDLNATIVGIFKERQTSYLVDSSLAKQIEPSAENRKEIEWSGDLLNLVHQRTAIERLKQEIIKLSDEGETVNIVSHSLGTVISYKALQELDLNPNTSTIKINSFVTMGSPLGDKQNISVPGVSLDLVKGVIVPDVNVPLGNINSWTNIYSPQDWISGSINLSMVNNIVLNSNDDSLLAAHSLYYREGATFLQNGKDVLISSAIKPILVPYITATSTVPYIDDAFGLLSLDTKSSNSTATMIFDDNTASGSGAGGGGGGSWGSDPNQQPFANLPYIPPNISSTKNVVPVNAVNNPTTTSFKFASLINASGYYLQATGGLNGVMSQGSGAWPNSIIVDPTGRFVYATNDNADAVAVYNINQTTGALTVVGTAAAGNGPYKVTVDPTGRFVYVANAFAGTISVYTIDQATGALSAGTAVAAMGGPTGIAVDPTGKFVYVANFGSDKVSVYTIDQATGALAAGTAVAATGLAPGAAVVGPWSLTVDPTGKFVYVANYSSGTVSVYNIDPTTGALSAGTTANAGSGPYNVAIDPSGRFAYVPNRLGGSITIYSIDQTTGSLTVKMTVGTGAGPMGVAVNRTGRFLYVTNYETSTVTVYSIDQTTGTLTIKMTVGAGSGPNCLAVDPTGRFVYVTNAFSNTVSAYSIGSSMQASNNSVIGNIEGTTSSGGTTPVTLAGFYDPASPSAFVWEQTVNSYNSLTGQNVTYDTPPNAYAGFLTGYKADDNTMKAKWATVYVRDNGSAGIHLGTLTGIAATPNYTMSGTINAPVEMVSSGIGATPANLYPANVTTNSLSNGTPILGGGSFSGGGTMSPSYHTWESLGITGLDWGVWRSVSSGTYNGPISLGWSLSEDYNYVATKTITGSEVKGTSWTGNKLEGTTTGYGADINTGKTWVSIGDIIGTYDPVALTYQAVSAGSWIETDKFLWMATNEPSKLQGLNIPCVEVGSANLAGSNNYGTGTINVTMNNVKFFSNTAAGPAKIWAAGQRQMGNWTGAAPPAGTAANIAGGGLSATFTVKTFDTVANNNWNATITNGTGGFNGSTTFRGAAAGTINTGAKTFSGTAAGVAK